MIVLLVVLLAVVLGGYAVVRVTQSVRSHPLIRTVKARANAEQVARLEAWHRYWHKGCYSGECEHEDRKPTRGGVEVEVFMVTSMDTEEFMALYERKCVRVDRRTKDNRFPYLSEWLSDVDRMLKAGNALVEREPK